MSLRSRPGLARVLPFAVYIGFLVAESAVGSHVDGRWLYAAQVVAVAALLAYFWPVYHELVRPPPVRALDWALGAALGAVLFAVWIHLDFPWAQFGSGRNVAPDLTGGAAIAGFAVRVFGVIVLVPVMEELFWRSFLMRWLDNHDFLAVAPAAVTWRSIAISAVVFGMEHHLWLAGIVAGVAFGWLYKRTGNLWIVVLAHAVTNAALEYWVVRTGNWHFL